MSEEITYAHLNFPGSRWPENTPALDEARTRGPPAPSYIWRPVTLTLTFLCLLLLIGLGVLGSIFYTTLKIEMEKLNVLQKITEGLQSNVSAQLMSNRNSSEKIQSLSLELQELATRLCRELYEKEREHKCKPCPEKWMWHKEKCYLLSQEYKNWQDNKKFCSAQNASLLQIKSKHALEFVKAQKSFLYHWLGLSPTRIETEKQKVNQNLFSSAWFEESISDRNKMYCAYIQGEYIYSTSCSTLRYCACEKEAHPVKAEHVLTSDSPDGSL